MQQDKSTVALALVGVLALTIIGIVVGEIMEAPVTDLSLVATAIAGGLIGWLAPNLRRNDKPVEVEVTPAPRQDGWPQPRPPPTSCRPTRGTEGGAARGEH